ncbi:DUF190 domain-containing protein [Deinococcus aluminii]|uniref:DUF190 domain-containing protein n=1 Tax=Deinococcus aluminii TaxID=1656885 RepID=A0ABP9XFB2_9DEIO
MTRNWQDMELLRVFLGTSDHVAGESAADALLRHAKAAGLQGGTVLQGVAGFGQHAVLHRPGLFRLSPNLPVVVEFVDDAGRIEAFVPTVMTLLRGGGLVTRERLRALRGGEDRHDV